MCRSAEAKFESADHSVRVDLLKAAVLHDLSCLQMLDRVPGIVDGCLTHLIRLSSQGADFATY